MTSRLLPLQHTTSPTPLQLLAGAIRQRRLHAFLTQQDLARRAGVHRDTIRSLEHGLHRPTPRTVARVAAALETPPDRLVDDPLRLWGTSHDA